MLIAQQNYLMPIKNLGKRGIPLSLTTIGAYAAEI
jgi:hypothetical protein